MAVARAAAGAGSRVELVGKVGDGPDGDAILLAVAGAGVGHVAVIRSVGGATIEDDTDGREATESLDTLAGLDGDGEHGGKPVLGSPASVQGPPLDAGDVELALRYLPDYDVVVIAQPLDEAATAAVADAAGWANAGVIAIATGGESALPAEATILEAPSEDAEGAFATVVGRYAASLDRGDDPGDAFTTASSELGWTPVGSE
jgi:hypothetical protein